ncbi:Uma2 family endonuclease [Vacuolonema iberomarrocanum]|uniref:Uma2 family endonuclease n=1 Tax=Vacuolonema iberomarrocanum TaxID=3454632 RepID=UPI0019FC6739|nr:Uma2 family endonuclease [filamentous cyanobacterium LEGE 07170]
MASIASNRVRWTVADLESLPENSTRYEIIDGDLFVTRAPHADHQDIAGAIYAELRAWSKKSQSGKSFFAPGVIFSEADNVIPDVVWISSERLENGLDEAGHLIVAPELIVEVLSSSEKDRERDRTFKLKLYSVQGVAEYWICDRFHQQIEIFRRQDALLTKACTLFAADTLTSPLLPDFNCSVAEIFS